MNKFILSALTVAMTTALVGCGSDDDNAAQQLTARDIGTSSNNDWFQQGQVKITNNESVFDAISKAKGEAKNIILFVICEINYIFIKTNRSMVRSIY